LYLSKIVFRRISFSEKESSPAYYHFTRNLPAKQWPMSRAPCAALGAAYREATPMRFSSITALLTIHPGNEKQDMNGILRFMPLRG
jgi:hypothetical protein